MATQIYGWCGKILNLDLSNSRVTELDTMDYADRFLGGRGIATRIYWDEVGPDVDAFDPENRLILMSGPLGATGTQGAFTDPVETVFMNPDVIVPGPGEEVVSRKGQTLDRDVFDTMRKEFYNLRGWDVESGLQKAETLEGLGLPDLVQELKQIDMIRLNS